MQMSQTEFFAFVEGVHVDGHVHGGNCDRALTPLGIGYRVSPADDLPGDGGGKTRLRSYYEHLRDSSSLVTDFKGKTTIVAFFMDKDIDDRLGVLISSPHVFYTDFYDVENHVFHEGDVATAVGSACSLPPNWCREEFGSSGIWQEVAARLWIEWVRLCFAAKLLKIPGAVNYRRPSPLNDPSHHLADPELVAFHQGNALAGVLPSIVSRRDWQSARAVVDGEYATGNWDAVFKGKWYACILGSQLLANSPNKIDSKHLVASLVKHVAATMKFDSAWSISMQKRVRSLAVGHGLGKPRGFPETDVG